MIDISDLRKVPKNRWARASVLEVVRRDYPKLTPESSLAEALDLMYIHNIGRIPVVDADDFKRLVGIISKTDIIRIEELMRTER